MARPFIYVLAGVNGAGKSSIGGHELLSQGLVWYNPDTFARELVAAVDCNVAEANALAWQEGMRRLDRAIVERRNFAFETTLGGHSVAAQIRAAAETHDIHMWFCALDSPDRHIARVRARVVAGGHDIPEAMIRARYPAALENLIALLPHLTRVRVYDNSVEAAPGAPIPDPIMVADIRNGRLAWPRDVERLQRSPVWARAVLEAALG